MVKESTLSCLFDIGGLIAGFILASQLGVFQLSPWAIALYPAIISIKGVTTGLLTGRLSTSLHLGTVYPRFFRNTQSFYKLIGAIVVLTLITSAAISSIAILFGILFWEITVADFSAILTVMVATMSLGLLTTLITTKVMFFSFKRSLDPEIIVFPAISTMADIIITFLYVGVLSLFFSGDLGKWSVTMVGLMNLVLVIITLWSYLKETDFLRIIKESLATLLLIAIVANITGTALRGINTLAGTRREIFIVYPALIDLVGDVGLIIGSAATTKLALGELTPSLSSIKKHTKNILSTWISSILLLGVIGILASAMNNKLSLLGISNLLPILFLTNILALIAIVVISYAISIVTFKRGLDPDNFVIPIISTLADCITTIVIIGVLTL